MSVPREAIEVLGEDRFKAMRMYLAARPGMIQDGAKHYVHVRDLLLNSDVLNLAVAMAPDEAQNLSDIFCYWEFGGEIKPAQDAVAVELLNDGKVYGVLGFNYGQEAMQVKFKGWPAGVDKTSRAEKFIGPMVVD